LQNSIFSTGFIVTQPVIASRYFGLNINVMETLQSTLVAVKCPHCGNKFNPEEAIEHGIRVELQKEFERKASEQSRFIENQVRKQELEKYSSQLRMLEEDRKVKALKLKELETAALAVQQREQHLREREERADLEMKRKLMESEKLIYAQAEKRMLEKMSVEFQEREQKLVRERESLEVMMKKKAREESEKARDEERMKLAELQKKLDDQNRLINEMKRKSEQGSMQMQGEVQELAIEDYLETAFPRDEIEEISKGKRGGDCVHVVKDQYGRICGRILYESKRTKHFSHEWICKLKDDMRLKQADLGVIVTEAFPEGMCRFGEIEGIWVCTFAEFKALALLFRHNLVRMGEVVASQENKGDKMQMIYSYVTGNEFKQKLEAAFESYSEMQDDLTKEKTLFNSQWAKREKRMQKAMENLVCLYGDVRGIAGGAVQEIKSLEIPDLNLLQ
jgi:hypothetical protein